MDGTGEDSAADNPKVDGRSPKCAGKCTEDRTKTGDIQKLNHKNFPRRQNDKVNAVGLSNGRRRRVSRLEDVVDNLAVNHITANQSGKCNQKCNHCWRNSKKLRLHLL